MASTARGRRSDDTVSQAYERLEDRPFKPTGTVVGPVEGIYSAKLGDLVIADSNSGDVIVRLPVPTTSRFGESITVVNIGPNRALVTCPSGVEIEQHSPAWREYAITKSVPPIQFVAVDSKRYVAFGRPRERTWVEWNGRDTEQFGLPFSPPSSYTLPNGKFGSAGSATGTKDFDIVFNAGIRWIRMQNDAGSGGNGTTGMLWVPFESPPPHRNYSVSCDWVIRAFTGGTDAIIGMGVSVRGIAYNDHYFTRYNDKGSATTDNEIMSTDGTVAAPVRIGNNHAEPNIRAIDEGTFFCSLGAMGSTPWLEADFGERFGAFDDTGVNIDRIGYGAISFTNSGAAAGGDHVVHIKNAKITLYDDVNDTGA